MCSSLMRWIQSMEPLERETVRENIEPSSQPTEPRHSPANCLTGGHRRQAGTPPGSSTHARSHPCPRLSHSTLGSGHPMQPQHPGAQTWRGRAEQGGRVTCELSPTRGPVRVLSAQAHSQRLHVGVLGCIPHLHRAVVGSAVELVGTSSEGQSLERTERVQRVWTTEGRPRGALLKVSHMTQEPVPPEPGTCLPVLKQLHPPQACRGSS